jgi:uncharacterized repeat protein (TIGR03803 family)
MNRQRLLFALALLIVASADSLGQTFQELHALTCDWNDTTGWDCSREGVGPQCALVQAKDGNFYGTTTGGGRWGCGTIFKITPEGEFTTLAHFDDTNGCWPYGSLLQARDGNFYGTTRYGRRHGTIFRFTPPGTITDMGAVDFDPVGDLAEGPDRKLYAVCMDGGVADYCHGTILRFTTNGASELVHTFCGSEGGLYPSGGLLLASDGYFYGVTAGGGAWGSGTVYRISTNGEFATIASFLHWKGNAEYPNGRLVEAPDGSLYGAADSPGHVGAIFRVTKDGVLTTLADGVNQYPRGPLVLANDGNFYGCTYGGGDYCCPISQGTLFRLTHDGAFTVLFSFTMYSPPYPGSHPYAGLVQGSDGNLYGTTWQGGAGQAGNVFRIIMPGPLLSSTQAGRDLVLSWRTNYTGYLLQFSTDLSRNEWNDCTNTFSIVGGQYVVTNSLSDSARFFRLSRISQPAEDGNQ